MRKRRGAESVTERQLLLTADQLEQILAHCRREAPNEACGLLTGRAGRVARVWPCRNLLASPEAFQVDPQDQLTALRSAWAEGDDLVGLYHSHPQTPARPSARDIAEAFYPEAVYLIVSLRDGEQAKAFSIAAGAVRPVEISIQNPSDQATK